MANMNALANAKNPYQGNMKKVLAVCSAGLLRSPTVAYILSNPPFNFNTRAAGAEPEYALIPISDLLVHWAEEIVCVEQWQADRVHKLLKDLGETKPVHVVKTPDQYRTRDPELIKHLTPKLMELFSADITA